MKKPYRLLFGCGILLVVFGAVLIFMMLWFRPYFLVKDAEWSAKHTISEYGSECMRAVRRYPPALKDHDIFMSILYCGDRRFCEHLIRSPSFWWSDSDAFYGMRGKTAMLLRDLTGHGENGTKRKEWVAWLDANDDKPMVEWWCSSLTNAGITVDLPLDHSERERLYRYLGRLPDRDVGWQEKGVPLCVRKLLLTKSSCPTSGSCWEALFDNEEFVRGFFMQQTFVNVVSRFAVLEGSCSGMMHSTEPVIGLCDMQSVWMLALSLIVAGVLICRRTSRRSRAAA